MPNEQESAALDQDETSGKAPETGAAETGKGDVPTEVRAVLDKERHARREAEKALKAAESRLAEIADKDKTEQQRLTESVATLTARAEAAELRAMRLSVAAKTGLPQELAERLVGANEDEMADDAKRLKKLMGPSVPPMDSGVRNDNKPPAQDVNALLAAAVR